MGSSDHSGHRAHHAGRAARRIALLDDQLQDSLRRLEAARRDIEVLRDGLSHVLRNRLPSVERLAGRLRHRGAGLTQAASPTDLMRASEELRRIGQLLERLLALGDIDRRHIAPRPVDLTALAWEVVGRLRTREPGRSVNVHVTPDLWVEADPSLLELLLTVLLEDAWRRTRRAEQAGIQIGRAPMGAETVCFVRDNGVGFEPVAAGRPGPATHAQDGPRRWNGLGLILARRIIERHGGRLWSDGGPGTGATILFTLAPAGERGSALAAQDQVLARG